MVQLLSNLYSQISQDYFVNHLLDKDNGFFVDIGAGVGHLDARTVPVSFMSNTFALEIFRGWKGVAIDYDEIYVEQAKRVRSCDVVCEDLLKRNINDILERHNVPNEIDYLSFDVDGAQDKVFSEFDFSKYRARVITYEHDMYRNEKEQYDEKSRARFKELGYQMLFGNVSIEMDQPVEDWYVDQEVFDEYKHFQKDDVNQVEVIKSLHA